MSITCTKKDFNHSITNSNHMYNKRSVNMRHVSSCRQCDGMLNNQNQRIIVESFRLFLGWGDLDVIIASLVVGATYVYSI